MRKPWLGTCGGRGLAHLTAAHGHAYRGIDIGSRDGRMKIGDRVEDRLFVLVLIFIFIFVFVFVAGFILGVFVLGGRVIFLIELILFAELRELVGRALSAALERADLRVVHNDAERVFHVGRVVRAGFARQGHRDGRTCSYVFRFVG